MDSFSSKPANKYKFNLKNDTWNWRQFFKSDYHHPNPIAYIFFWFYYMIILLFFCLFTRENPFRGCAINIFIQQKTFLFFLNGKSLHYFKRRWVSCIPVCHYYAYCGVIAPLFCLFLLLFFFLAIIECLKSSNKL